MNPRFHHHRSKFDVFLQKSHREVCICPSNILFVFIIHFPNHLVFGEFINIFLYSPIFTVFQSDSVDQLPTVAARHEAMKGLTQRTQTIGTCFVSYVGKANFGAAERYIREMYTEVYSAHALGAEISAIGGTFCISFMQLFTTDVYLNAFLSELKQIGLDYTVLERRPIRVASVADYRK